MKFKKNSKREREYRTSILLNVFRISAVSRIVQHELLLTFSFDVIILLSIADDLAKYSASFREKLSLLKCENHLCTVFSPISIILHKQYFFFL